MIKKSDLVPISYQEFGSILSKLEVKVKESGIKFDLIVPILRSGAFTGMHLASKLGVTNILPAQYKYEYVPIEKTIKKLEFAKLSFSVPENANILITDSNTVWGGIASQVVKDVKDKYPNAKIYFASANLDQSIKKMENIEEIFYGQLSNEKRELPEKVAEEKRITNEILIFPWEDLEEQWKEINDSQQNVG